MDTHVFYCLSRDISWLQNNTHTQTEEWHGRVSQWTFWASRFHTQLPSEVQTTHTHTQWCLLNRDEENWEEESKEEDIVRTVNTQIPFTLWVIVNYRRQGDYRTNEASLNVMLNLTSETVCVCVRAHCGGVNKFLLDTIFVTTLRPLKELSDIVSRLRLGFRSMVWVGLGMHCASRCPHNYKMTNVCVCVTENRWKPSVPAVSHCHSLFVSRWTKTEVVLWTEDCVAPTVRKKHWTTLIMSPVTATASEVEMGSSQRK